MGKEYWLSYSGYKTYRDCPKRYRLSRVERKDPPTPESKHFAVIGWTVQRVYEDFYNQELWRLRGKVSDALLELAPKYFYQYLDENHVDFNDITCKLEPMEMLAQIEEIIPKVLTGIKREKLLGPYARSEIILRAQLQSSYYLYGIVDFLIRQSTNEVLLIDGKASKHREKYVDEEQVDFYSLAFRLVHNRRPDKVGYFYYRFADDEEQAFDWHVPDAESEEKIRQNLVAAFTNIQKKRFGATPSPSTCKWCPYETVCTERQQQIMAAREKKRWNRAERGEETLPPLSKSSEGSVMIGFGGKLEDTK